MRGELAEKLGAGREPASSVVFTLRKGIMFPEKPGVMQIARAHGRGRGLLLQPPALEPQDDRPATSTSSGDVVAKDKYTVVFNLKEYNAEWDYRLAWGFYSVIMPKEVVDAGATNWKNVNGTGPFMLTDFVAGNSNTYTKNPNYWDKEKIGGAGLQAAVRRQADLPHHQGRGDPACRDCAPASSTSWKRSMRASDADDLKKSAPHLQWSRKRLSILGIVHGAAQSTSSRSTTCACAARMNMAINKKEIIEAHYSGEAEMLRLSRCIPTGTATSIRSTRCRPRSRSSTSTIPRRPRSC